MKTLFIDCGMGAAGDMLAAALLELVPNRDEFITRLNSVGIPKVVFSGERSVKCGILGTHLKVSVCGTEEGEHEHHHEHEHTHEHTHEHHEHEHHHASMKDIEEIVSSLSVSEKVRSHVLEVYRIIAKAESEVHGVPVHEIHFHEVGNLDAIADITAVSMLFEELSPDEVIASPIHVGSGSVKCAHGILPVPAPATAKILLGLPIYSGEINGELCTPTGAALLRHFVTRFEEMPRLTPTAIGYGMGKKDFPRANCVRAILGDTEDTPCEIVELRCNLDDMTGEEIGFTSEILFEAGALDVYTVPIGMKKSRPGVMLCVMTTPETREEITRLIFRHTTTLGVREYLCRRRVMERKIETHSTPYGEVRKKVSCGMGTEKEKYEFDDLAKIAKDRGISLFEARELIK